MYENDEQPDQAKDHANHLWSTDGVEFWCVDCEVALDQDPTPFEAPVETAEAKALRVAQYHVDHCGAVVKGWIDAATKVALELQATPDATTAYKQQMVERLTYCLNYFVRLSAEQDGNVARLVALQAAA